MSPALRRALAAVVAGLMCLIGLVSVGDADGTAIERVGWVVMAAVLGGVPAGLYIAGGMGYGLLMGRAIGKRLEARREIEAAAGLALMLSVTHALGVLGLLNRSTATVTVGLGVAVLMVDIVRRVRGGAAGAAGAGGSLVWLAALPAGVVLAIASSSAPGWLWGSEFGGFDALSYHLTLPGEWIAAGRVWPMEHNVYSFLPGFVEAGFMHVALLSGAGGAHAMIDGEGWRLLGAQWLHAGLAVVAAWVVAGVARGVARECGADARAAGLAAAVAGGLTLALPWVVVVGSLAYNEMAMVLFGAGAMLAARERGAAAGVRGVLVGALVGAACCAKPTALFMIGPAAGVMMLAAAPKREWMVLVSVGAIAGAAMLMPWLVRNALACGNPVFPALSGVFGSGHWTAEQVSRFAAAHQFEGSMMERVRVALWSDPNGAAGAGGVMRWRGLTNPQWGLLFPLAAAAGAAIAVRRAEIGKAGRVIAAALGAGLVMQVMAWMMLTHVQARFLMPTIVTAVPLIAVAVAMQRRAAGVAAGAVIVLGHAVATVAVFGGERGGAPGALLVGGAGVFIGEPYEPMLHDEMPIAATNRAVKMARERGEAAGVLLVGGSTPLYFKAEVTWATTWDESLLARLMREHERAGEGAGRAVAAGLRERGIGFVLVDAGELVRLERSGWLDEALGLERVMAQLEAECEMVASWPGQALFRVRE